MLGSSSWQLLECWDSLLAFDILPSQVGFSVLLAFIVCSTALLNLVFKTTNVLEALFWTELLLVSSIFGLAAVSALLQSPTGFVYCFFLLNSTAVEAAIGMSVIVRLLHTGRSISLHNMRSVF